LGVAALVNGGRAGGRAGGHRLERRKVQSHLSRLRGISLFSSCRLFSRISLFFFVSAFLTVVEKQSKHQKNESPSSTRLSVGKRTERWTIELGPRCCADGTKKKAVPAPFLFTPAKKS